MSFIFLKQISIIAISATQLEWNSFYKINDAGKSVGLFYKKVGTEDG